MRFDTNVSPSLAWQFTADSNIIEILPGEVYEMDYTVKNLSDDQTFGIASYNVLPTKVGKYPIICAELCGPYHGGMRASIIVEEESDYNEWFNKNKKPEVNL